MGRLRTRHFLGGLLLAAAAALAAGCARARVQNVQADRMAAVPRPGRIVVFDFDTGAADVRVGTSPRRTARQAVGLYVSDSDTLAQAVAIVAYEWFKLASGETLPFAMPQKSVAAPKEQLLAFFASLERELEKVEFFRPPDKRETMQINLRNIFTRMQPTQQDIQTLHGVIMSIAEGRKGPARGGVLDGAEAEMLRALLAEHGPGRVPKERGPVRGLFSVSTIFPSVADSSLTAVRSATRREIPGRKASSTNCAVSPMCG